MGMPLSSVPSDGIGSASIFLKRSQFSILVYEIFFSRLSRTCLIAAGVANSRNDGVRLMFFLGRISIFYGAISRAEPRLT